MLVRILKSKLHMARVTETRPEYEGSITLSKSLCERAGLLEGEMVLVANFENGERFETYVIITDREGVVGLNGPAAKLGEIGDRLIVMSYALVSPDEASKIKPKVIKLDENNNILSE